MILSYLFLVLAAVLDVMANLLLERSDGFKHKKFGIPALIMVCLAYSLLAQVTKHLDLTVAYVSWGAMAILGSTLAARVLLGQKLNWRGWLGLGLVFCSIGLLKFS